MNTKLRSALFTAILGAAIATPAHAQPQTTSALETCLQNASDQARQYSCYQAETAKQKRRLNNAYNRLIKNRSPESLAALNQSQKDWLRGRDSTYNFLSGHVAGSADAALVVSEGFLLNSTAERAELLEGVAAVEAH
ncbi:DUF1311 domain-containing protein [Burkholderia arboris]|uniref:lysozyme inhibitor LprI family protein n=1 Tax=Burkholderia arboris TaxID=488730 RepID=UPI001CF49B49|nr:lysozyme inhibitor LprI family protein [Burkholderia arboris]MCA8037140.1 DUF1311 domain-containing protein [Burkholderia arboris]